MIYIMYPNCMSDIMIITQAVLQIKDKDKGTTHF